MCVGVCVFWVDVEKKSLGCLSICSIDTGIHPRRFKVYKTLGSGSFATVLLVRALDHHQVGKLVALKVSFLQSYDF